jgi:hypothetical protein
MVAKGNLGKKRLLSVPLLLDLGLILSFCWQHYEFFKAMVAKGYNFSLEKQNGVINNTTF